ncbi:MAG TPA: PSD1 and planctomycete cytochrome C domain-containing protein [Draconibacterium sp.]|nr:PSD1 and planctomycete cytochrome C domain-containing protein [Draconibacterium sp.]
MKRQHFILIIVILAAGLAFGIYFLSNQKKSYQNTEISYNRDIRPILSDKCFLCHGPDANTREAGLRLDLQEGAFAELLVNKGHFAVVPGSPEESELIRRIESTDPAVLMPLPESNLPQLTPEEIAVFKQWIKEGAKYEKHWSFIPPVQTDLPDVKKESWVKNEIDNFILEKIEKKGLKPNDEASREILIKRAFADITGLAPDSEEIFYWSGNSEKNWYSQLIDTLLQKPAYGEKMAILWMDLARYADSYGFQDDNIRSQWPWRDWVINAFNTNISYDKFLTYQIAGDLLPDANKETILATAFFRNHKYTEEGGVIDEEYRVSYNIDKTNTFGKAVLGVTIECAQCHDHKYDPFSQKDYFQLYAFFNESKEIGYEGDVSQSTPAKNPKLFITEADRKNLMSYINARDTMPLQVSVMGDSIVKKPTFILSRGSYDAPTNELVKPTALESVMPFDTVAFSRNRLGLAEWTIDKNNPLTARVFVNFMWQEIFGKGLVKSSTDYGLQGDLPSHPELLDWLGVDFVEHKWDIKYLVKKVLTSKSYCQSSNVSSKQLEMDPENIYYSRAPRIRFKAEIVRDWILSSSGLLNPEIGGPSVKPYQPKGVWESTTSGRGVLASYKQDHGPNLYRRGLYTIFKLTAPPPGLMIFDASSRDQCEGKRISTNTPLQALTMLNDPTVLEASRVLAENISGTTKELDEKIEQAFEAILVRKPTKFEKDKLLDYCMKQQQFFNANPDVLKSTLEVGEYEHPKFEFNKPEAGALMKTILIIYNLEEAITRT